MKCKSWFIIAVAVLGSTISSSLQAAVANAAWLQGDQLVTGTSHLAAPAPISLDWNLTSSIDGTVFDHSVWDSGKLTVKEDGDYFVALTAPIHSGTADRVTSAFEVYVNGEAAPGALGQSTYIRDANGHRESSGHLHVLLTGLVAGDVIELKTYRINQLLGNSRLGTASLFVERIDPAATAFSGFTTGATGGPNINQPADQPDRQLVWTSDRADAGFSHTDDGHEIQIGEPGVYLVYFNLPVSAQVNRISVVGQINLDGVRVPNGQAQQGYLRNASGHNLVSIHWAGLVEVTSPNQILTVETFQGANSGEALVQADKQGSLLIQKLDDTAGLLNTALFDFSFDFNPDQPTVIPWNDPAATFDSTVYSLAAGFGEITVQEDGDFLLLYNDVLDGTSADARPNPKIKVNVNGQPLDGAETKTHYIRKLNNHTHASASLVFLLSRLQAGDTITVTTEREANAGPVYGLSDLGGDTAMALLTLVKKDSFVPDPASGLQPRISSFSGGVLGFSIQMSELGAPVDLASVQVELNGEPVDATVSRDGFIVQIEFQHDAANLPARGATQQVHLAYDDEAGNSFTDDLTYTVDDPFTRIAPGLVMEGADTSQPGFLARITQLTDFTGSAGAHGNTSAGAELQLAGIHPLTMEPYVNEASPSTASPDVVNFEQEALPIGNFSVDNGYSDALIPGIPGTTGSTDGIAAEFTALLDLDVGLHTLGVNSDDGFRVSTSRNPVDLLRTTLGVHEGGRGSSDTLFDIVVEQAGLYPVRLLWYEGTGGANVEFFSVTRDGEKVLINDTSHPDAIRAYQPGLSPPYVSRLETPHQSYSSLIEVEITDGDLGVVDGSIALSIDGNEVTPNITKSGGVTTVSFDNQESFAIGRHTVQLDYDEDSSPVFTRTASFEFTVPTGIRALYDDNPVAYWTLGESSGDIAFSEVGTGLEGTYASDSGGALPLLGVERLAVGSPTTAARFVAAEQNVVQLPDHPDINTNGPYEERTIALWFNAASLPAEGEKAVLWEEGGTARGYAVYLVGTGSDSTADLYFNAWNDANDGDGSPWGGPAAEDPAKPVFVQTSIDANTTYHLVFVMDGDPEPSGLTGTLTGYLNGAEVGSVSGVGLMYGHGDEAGIGGVYRNTSFHDVNLSAAGGAYFDGVIDEVVVFNSALNAERVQAHFNEGNTEVPMNGGVGRFTSITADGDSITISWEGEGTLQSATSVDGSYTDVPGASNPFTEDIGANSTRFYRLRQ